MQVYRATNAQTATPADLRRFWAKVTKTETCWIWTAANHKGYGEFWFQGYKRPAHRFAYELLVGPIPVNLDLDHVCRNPPCVRPDPDHLEPVTPQVNTLRGNGICADEAKRTACPRGHKLTGANLAPWHLERGWRMCRTCARAQWRVRSSGSLTLADAIDAVLAEPKWADMASDARPRDAL